MLADADQYMCPQRFSGRVVARSLVAHRGTRVAQAGGRGDREGTENEGQRLCLWHGPEVSLTQEWDALLLESLEPPNVQGLRLLSRPCQCVVRSGSGFRTYDSEANPNKRCKGGTCSQHPLGPSHKV